MIKIIISTLLLFGQLALANEEVVIDPIFSTFYMCAEHPEGENMGLGSDCVVYQPTNAPILVKNLNTVTQRSFL